MDTILCHNQRWGFARSCTSVPGNSQSISWAKTRVGKAVIRRKESEKINFKKLQRHRQTYQRSTLHRPQYPQQVRVLAQNLQDLQLPFKGFQSRFRDNHFQLKTWRSYLQRRFLRFEFRALRHGKFIGEREQRQFEGTQTPNSPHMAQANHCMSSSKDKWRMAELLFKRQKRYP